MNKNKLKQMCIKISQKDGVFLDEKLFITHYLVPEGLSTSNKRKGHIFVSGGRGSRLLRNLKGRILERKYL